MHRVPAPRIPGRGEILAASAGPTPQPAAQPSTFGDVGSPRRRARTALADRAECTAANVRPTPRHASAASGPASQSDRGRPGIGAEMTTPGASSISSTRAARTGTARPALTGSRGSPADGRHEFEVAGCLAGALHDRHRSARWLTSFIAGRVSRPASAGSVGRRRPAGVGAGRLVASGRQLGAGRRGRSRRGRSGTSTHWPASDPSAPLRSAADGPLSAARRAAPASPRRWPPPVPRQGSRSRCCCHDSRCCTSASIAWSRRAATASGAEGLGGTFQHGRGDVPVEVARKRAPSPYPSRPAASSPRPVRPLAGGPGRPWRADSGAVPVQAARPDRARPVGGEVAVHETRSSSSSGRPSSVGPRGELPSAQVFVERAEELGGGVQRCAGDRPRWKEAAVGASRRGCGRRSATCRPGLSRPPGPDPASRRAPTPARSDPDDGNADRFGASPAEQPRRRLPAARARSRSPRR